MAENNGQNQNWWSTLPGILTGTAALITAVGGLLVILNSDGCTKQNKDPINAGYSADTTETAITSKPPKSNHHSPFYVGEKYDGGIVFYIDNSGQHGLIAAEKDLNTVFDWKDAYRKCHDLGPGWHLPTKDELNNLYVKKYIINGLAFNLYWSCDDWNLGVEFAWTQNFNNGNQEIYLKDTSICVRPVRPF